MKTKLFSKLILLFIVSFALIACTKNTLSDNAAELMESGTPVAILEVKSDGVTTFNLAGETPPFDSTADLTADEIEFVYAVREDEKVARDLYTAFFEKYSLKTFSNISRSEANHMRAVEILLEYYEIDFPAAGEYGVFEDPARQAIYDTLLAKGNTALEGFRVMAQLEEENIVSYRNVLSDITNPNIKIVIENLGKASENHFKAAIRQITALGGTYAPKLMNQEEYKAMIAKGFEQGKRYRYKNMGDTTNSGKKMNGNTEKRGKVNSYGTSTGSSNGTTPGGEGRKGEQGKGYRGGK